MADASFPNFKNYAEGEPIPPVDPEANGDSAILPFFDVPWAYADAGNALTVNSGTTTTKVTLYYSQD